MSEGNGKLIKLTDMQELLCREYIVDMNKFQAAIRAGYSENYAKRITVLFDKPKIKKRIEQLQEERLQKVDKKGEDVIKELENVAYSRITDYFHVKNGELILNDTSKLTDEQIAAIESVKQGYDKSTGKRVIYIKLYNKINALQLLGQHHNVIGNGEDAANDYNFTIVNLTQNNYEKFQGQIFNNFNPNSN